MRIIIRRRADFPECIRHIKQVKGICIGECINEPKKRLIDAGHAHCSEHISYGWICLRTKYLFQNRNILLHEAAHIINTNTDYRDHGKEWKKIVVEIGGTFKSFRVVGGRTSLDYTHIYR
jgi:predicted SprT family Zn-dependent metalloprotease